MGIQETDARKAAGSDEVKVVDEASRLRAERDALEAEVERLRDRKAKAGRARRVLAGFLVVLTCLLVPIAVTAGWTKRTLLWTDRWVATVEPMVDHPSVTDALARRISAEVMTLIDAEAVVADALPPRAALLAGPMTSAVGDFVEDQVATLLASEQFRELWVNANRFAHTQLVAVLRGEGEVLSTQDGRVVLNLLPVINEVLVRVEARGESLFGKDIDLPEISSGEVPEVARAKLESALGVTVPPDLGEIVIYESNKLEAAQETVKAFDRGVFLLGLVALVLFAAALLVSKSRRRTLIQMSTGIVLVLVIIRRTVMYAQDQVVDLARPENQTALQAIVDDLFRGFFSLTLTVMLGLLAVIVVALVTGPYPWATKLRARARDVAGSFARLGSDGSTSEAKEWAMTHREGLQLGGAVVAILLLLMVEMSWPLFFLIVAVVGGFELWLSRMGPTGPAGPAASG